VKNLPSGKKLLAIGAPPDILQTVCIMKTSGKVEIVESSDYSSRARNEI
jgi:hypothetical protein